MKSESEIQREIMIAGNREGMRLFRNNFAKLKHNGRWLSFGIPGPGGSDLIGWKAITITEDMVGETVAVFASVEVKTPKGRVAEKQRLWLNLVRSFGGIGIIARSAEDL